MDDIRLGAGSTGIKRAFDTIAHQLRKAQEESEAFNRQLLQRNQELAAAAAVARAISAGPLELAATLQRALEVVLEVTGLTAGWIELLPEDGGEPVLATSVGLPQDFVAALAGSHPLQRKCTQTLDTRRPLVVQPLCAACPIQGFQPEEGRSVVCHASVPLLARTSVLGVLNLPCSDPSALHEQQLALLASVGQQLGVAIENARLWDALKHQQASRLQLIEQSIAAQEEERRHIARELHDQTGQVLTSILVWLRGLEAEAGTSATLVLSLAQLAELKRTVVDALDGVRRLAIELRPPSLDDLGLLPALRRYVRTMHEDHQLPVDFQSVGLDGVRLPPLMETALYRIVQEALTNVVQHACASSVSLFLAARADSVVAVVEDDGCGFDVHRLMNAPVNQHSLGLFGMQERAELLGGLFVVESAPGAGTTLFV